MISDKAIGQNSDHHTGFHKALLAAAAGATIVSLPFMFAGFGAAGVIAGTYSFGILRSSGSGLMEPQAHQQRLFKEPPTEHLLQQAVYLRD